MIDIHFDNIIYSLQRFGGASVYWNQVTRRILNDVRFNVSCKSASKYKRRLPSFSSANVFHSSHFRTCLSRKTKVVSTVHDLNYELGLLGHGVGARLNILERKLSYYSADALVCISESTKKDLLKIYPNLMGRVQIFTIHHGFTSLSENPNLNYNPRDIYDHYLLYVGGRKSYKQFDIALEAYFQSQIWKNGIKLICTGSSFDEKEQAMIKYFGLGNFVFSTSKVSEYQLGSLYKNAYALLYTSTYEGFGLPLIEAMSLNCPVIAANTSCIPEVAGDAALLCRPSDVGDFSNAIVSLENNDLRSQVISKGGERVKLFSWDKSAQEHAQVYLKIAGK